MTTATILRARRDATNPEMREQAQHLLIKPRALRSAKAARDEGGTEDIADVRHRNRCPLILAVPLTEYFRTRATAQKYEENTKILRFRNSSRTV